LHEHLFVSKFRPESESVFVAGYWPSTVSYVSQTPLFSIACARKKKKQIGMKHTQEGIGHGRQPAWQVEGEQWKGRGRRKGEARTTGTRERNLSITITQNQSNMV
jgi:hypothetical protein